MLDTIALLVGEEAKCHNDSLGSAKSPFTFLCADCRGWLDFLGTPGGTKFGFKGYFKGYASLFDNFTVALVFNGLAGRKLHPLIVNSDMSDNNQLRIAGRE